MRAVERDAAATLLHQYGEWLDGQGLVQGGEQAVDDRSHDDLVTAFLDDREATWLPEVVTTTS